MFDKIFKRLNISFHAYRLYYKLPFPIRKAISALNEDSICIDCGANIGVVACLFAKRGATVYAFEPNPYAYQELLRVSKLYTNIIPIQKAVGVVDDEVELYLHELSDSDPIGYSQGGSLMIDKPNVSKDNGLMVRSEDLSGSFLNCVGNP